MVDEQPVASTPSSVEEVRAEVPETVTEKTGKTFTEDEINRIVKERLDRERKKYSDYNDLKQAKAKLDEIEMASKTKEEQALAKLQALEAKLAEQENKIKQADLKDKKWKALESAKLGIPKDVTLNELLDMMPGESDEDIDAAIGRFKKLFPVSKAQGVGTQVSEMPVAGKKTIEEEIASINAAMRKPGVSQREKEEMTRQVIKLSNMKMRG